MAWSIVSLRGGYRVVKHRHHVTPEPVTREVGYVEQQRGERWERLTPESPSVDLYGALCGVLTREESGVMPIT